MKNNPKVSIIVPIWNTEKYLKRCLNSIINQTYKNLEIILVNDGSPDNSEKIVNEYVKTDKRIKVIHQKNQGLSAARNSGLKIATGDFVTFVDSDDEIKPEMIEELLSAIEKTNSDIAICSFNETFPNGKTKSFLKTKEEKIYSTKSALKAMLKEENFNLAATMKLYSKNSLGKIEFPIGKFHEDVGTTYKFIQNAKKVVFVPKDYYIYHHNNSSIISKFNEKKFDLIDLTDEMCSDIEKEYPDLKNVTNERRMRARFSLLRQIPLNHPKTKDLLNYLKTNKTYITKNPEATKIDKLALRLALLRPRLFQLAYKLKS